MKLEQIVGTTFFTRFTDATQFPLLVIGKDRWSYKEVARLGIIQPRACRILSKIASDLKVKTPKTCTSKPRRTSWRGWRGVASPRCT
jgi:hypothetical protein